MKTILYIKINETLTLDLNVKVQNFQEKIQEKIILIFI